MCCIWDDLQKSPVWPPTPYMPLPNWYYPCTRHAHATSVWTSSVASTHNLPHSSVLDCLSLMETPRIHLIILISILSIFDSTRGGPCQHGLLCGCKALRTWTDRPHGATSWRVFAADLLVCGPRVGDLARQLASWAGGKCIKLIWYSWLARARYYCLLAACSCRAAGKNNQANDLTFRSHMPWTELAA